MAGATETGPSQVQSREAVLSEEATDLKTLRAVLADAASVAGGLWLSYILVLLYLLIAVAGVTHLNLLFEDPVKLPFLGVDLQFMGFFIFGPALFLIVHAYVLLHLVLFAGKVGVFTKALRAQIPDQSLRAQLLWQLPSNIFVQMLAGTREVRRGFIGWMLRLIIQISLITAPLLLLLLFQVQLLPYHPKPWVAFWLRTTILIDLALLWLLWPSISRGEVTWIACRDFRLAWSVPVGLVRLIQAVFLRPWTSSSEAVSAAWHVFRRVVRRGTVVVAATASLLLLVLAFTVSTFPGEWLNGHLKFVPILRTAHELLFAGAANEVTGQPGGWLSNRLVLTDRILVDVDKLATSDVSHSFRGRDLTQAILSRSDLRKVDFTGANLNGANFAGAKLQNAHFGCASTNSGIGCAQLRGAFLLDAHLEGADLRRAELQEANLLGANLRGADLRSATLQGANVSHALLQGANLRAARLQGAKMFFSQLQGADLQEASLQGAALEAELQGADLSQADLEGADLRGAHLQAANLNEALLQGADLGDAELDGANLYFAQLQGANLKGAQMRGAMLTGAFVWRTRSDLKAGLTLIDACDLDKTPWDDVNGQTFAAWQESVLHEVPEGHLRQDAKNRLAILDPKSGNKAEDEGSAATFKAACDALPTTDAFEKLPKFLTELACSGSAAPYVARALLRSIRDRVSVKNIRAIADRLRQGKTRRAACPGVSGFSDADWMAVDQLDVSNRQKE